MSNLEDIAASVSRAANKYGFSYKLITAVVVVESGGNTFANRYEPNWRWFLRPSYWAWRLSITDKTELMNQATSFGLMQVMGAVAREHGFEGDLLRLTIPEVGLDYGCRHLKKMYDRYKTIDCALAAYNAGSPRVNRNGDFVNQKYVSAVLDKTRELEG